MKHSIFMEESGPMEKEKYVAYVSTYTMGKGDKHGGISVCLVTVNFVFIII